MSLAWLAPAVTGLYILALFALAKFSERSHAFLSGPRARMAIYVLSCCVCGSSLHFFGAADMATQGGMALITPIGPIVLFGLLHPLIVRMLRIVKSQNITSIADFVAARYGEAAHVGATVTLVATIGVMLFLTYQIKLISAALLFFIDPPAMGLDAPSGSALVVQVVVTLVLAGFAIGVGPRRCDTTERQGGLMLIVAVESVVRLAAFLAVAIYVTWTVYDGPADLLARAVPDRRFMEASGLWSDAPKLLAMGCFGTAVTLMQPQQFHATLIENRDIVDVRRATRFVPLYLVAFGICALPLAVSARSMVGDVSGGHDLSILALPTRSGSPAMAMIALLGGLSASTAMAFVGLITLSVMISNDVIIPLLVRSSIGCRRDAGGAVASSILFIRRVSIISMMVVAYACLRWLHAVSFPDIATLSLLYLAQIAPVCLLGLVWARATARGATAGLLAGTIVCSVMASPLSIVSSAAMVAGFVTGATSAAAATASPIDPAASILACSLLVNVLAFVLVSLTRPVTAGERAQAECFVHDRTPAVNSVAPFVSIGELQKTVAYYLGEDLTRRSFLAHAAERDIAFDASVKADGAVLRFGEHLIASAIGAASSRLVISLLLKRRDLSRDEALRFVDQVSTELQDVRDFFQRAISSAQEGMVVYDRNLQIVAWNQAAVDIFGYPSHLMRVGRPIEAFLRHGAERGMYGPGDIDDAVATRLATLLDTGAKRIVSRKDGRVFEPSTVRMPNVGLFVVYADVTEHAATEEHLEAENETLERRVRERTDDLERLNADLAKAKADADEANISKTRFLAAASHDLLQPLNAARLYATSLKERVRASGVPDDSLAFALKVEDSLEAVEDILTALLDISRLDAGAMMTEITVFQVDDIFRQLQLEFEPIADAKGLTLTFVGSSLTIVSDRRLLRRLLQNLVSNAIKYTVEGRVIVGARRERCSARLEVWDTGLGIPKAKQQDIFREFARLPSAIKVAPGVGLGLSIVQRLSRVLDHDVIVRSKPGRGSVFAVRIPRAAKDARTRRPTRGLVAKQRSLEGLVIAAIDDEPDILAGMEAMLGGWDCNVVLGASAANVERELARRNASLDVIIADYHLDDGNGISAIASLRERFGPCHAVLVTADRSTYVRDRAHDADIRVLSKPLKPAALRALLSQWRLVKEAAE